MQIVKLNLIPGGVLPVCFASQNDTGRVIRFLLFEGENVFTLSGAETIALRLQKPDGSELVESVTNTGADYVDVVTTADTCDTVGASVGEIVITDGGDVLGSANFGLFVESDAFDGGGIVTQTASGPIATFETNIETAFVSLKSDINPVQSGTGTPSPQNVRPISGFSALNVTRTGKNLFDKSLLIDQVAWNIFTLQLAPNALYTIGSNLPSALTNELPFYVFPSSGNPSSSNLVYSGHSVALTTLSDGIVKIQQRRVSGTDSFQNYNWQIENGLTAIDFEPYNGQTITVNFGQTVYGGVADVTNGKVTITHGYSALGDLSWSGSNGEFYSGSLTSTIKKGVSGHYDVCISDTYNAANKATLALLDNGEISVDTAGYIQIKDTSFTSASTFKSTMASVQLVYELATPIEIDITAENLTAISGENNVFSDTNGDMEVEYYIEV